MQHPIFIVLAVFEPNADYLKVQLESIAQQTHRDLHLICVIADIRSAELVRDLTADLAGAFEDKPDRIHFVQSATECDSVRAFESGLKHAIKLAQAVACDDVSPLIALSDQDDIWDTDKLQQGITALQDSQALLVHSDARIIDAAGKVLAPSMFRMERRHRNPGLRGLLYRNNITGMTCLFPLSLAELAVPFPAQDGVHFYHDLWLGLLASSQGKVKFLPQKLVSYRQHDSNIIGAVDRRERSGRIWYHLTAKRTGAVQSSWIRREAAAYGLARYLAHETFHRVTQAEAAGQIPASKHTGRALRPFLGNKGGAAVHLWDAGKLIVSGHWDLARIAVGFLLINFGRMSWALLEIFKTNLPEQISNFNTRLYSLSPGVVPHQTDSTPIPKTDDSSRYIDARKNLSWAPEFSAQYPAFTILLPSMNPTEMFAGILTAVDFGLGIAAKGHRVRFIATDLPIAATEATRQLLLGRMPGHADAQAKSRVSIHCGLQEETIPAHVNDCFLATAWWSAHLAHKLIRNYGFKYRKFFYLLQDYEPHFYPWGSEYADAMASYTLDFHPVFNTAYLREYFAERGFAFAAPSRQEPDKEGPLTFHPSINLALYTSRIRDPHIPGKPVSFALYGRPEVARNMFSTSIEVLERFLVAKNIQPEEINLVSVGLKHAPIRLPGGHVLTSLGKLPIEVYPGFLAQLDLGLSLMYSPHPSHLPIEMAASGVRVVTNTFGPKNLENLSPLILSAKPEPAALAAALGEAWDALGNPVPDDARQIDLGLLGAPLQTVIDQLAKQLVPILGEPSQ